MTYHCFEIELTERSGNSKIIMDGKPIATKAIKIEAEVGSVPLVTITIPASVKGIVNSEMDNGGGGND